MLCFSLKTFKPCAGQPYTYNYGAFQLSSFGYSYPMGFAGTNLYTQLVGSTDKLGCFNTLTHKACAGAWPVTVAGCGRGAVPEAQCQGVASWHLPAHHEHAVLHAEGSDRVRPRPRCLRPSGRATSTTASRSIIGARVYVTDNPAQRRGLLRLRDEQVVPELPAHVLEPRACCTR